MSEEDTNIPLSAFQRSVRLCFHNGPSIGVFERKVFMKEKNSISKIDRNAASSRLVMESPVAAFSSVTTKKFTVMLHLQDC